MNRTISIAPVHKTIVVQATPERAFEVFTAGIDRWWPKSKGIGAAPIRESVIEPFVGGRWYTKHEDGAEVVVGHVGVWQPPERFVDRIFPEPTLTPANPQAAARMDQLMTTWERVAAMAMAA